MKRALALIAIAAAVLIGGTLLARHAGSHPPPCTTHACIAADIKTALTGATAPGKAAITEASCDPASVKHGPGGTWTAACTVRYGDGSRASGTGSYVPGSSKVTFQPG